MRSSLKFVTGVFLFYLATPLLLHAVPIELEGPISNVTDNGDGSGSITVMGIVVDIPDGTPINTPTRELTIDQLADPTLLVGRTEDGFLGGTAIIIGDSDGIFHTAEDVFVEPAENVVLGIITDANCPIPGAADNPDRARFRLCANNSIENLGTATRRLTNGNTNRRMPADHPFNELGFQINLGLTHGAGLLIGASVGMEGYFAGGRLNWFAFEYAGIGVLRREDRPEISILRAQCRERDDRGIELDVTGAVHLPFREDPTGTQVRIRVPGGEVFGTVDVTPILPEEDPLPGEPPAAIEFGEYDFELDEDPNFIDCPDTIRAIFLDGVPGANARVNGEVDVRAD